MGARCERAHRRKRSSTHRVCRDLRQPPDFAPFFEDLPARLRPHLSFDYLSLLLKKEGGSERTWYVPDG